MSAQPGFFDLTERHAALSKVGDPLEKLSAVVNFEIFREDLDKMLARPDNSKGGRPAFDPVMMFKILVIQSLYGMSDLQTHFMILDRRTFERFLGLDDDDPVPDASTIWRFREALAQTRGVECLFDRFNEYLTTEGYAATGGQLVDATLVAAPRQRMTDEERAIVKAGGIPQEWQDKPAKLAQKDRDARWTLKRGRKKRHPDGSAMTGIATPVFGYKSHINIDREYGFVRKWKATAANRHDGSELAGLLNKDNAAGSIWGDTAYRSRKNEEHIRKAGLKSKIHFRKPRDKPLAPEHRIANAARSKIRALVEHPFAEQKCRMGLSIRTIGIARARAKIGMSNIGFNMRRLVFWRRKKMVA